MIAPKAPDPHRESRHLPSMTPQPVSSLCGSPCAHASPSQPNRPPFRAMISPSTPRPTPFPEKSSPTGPNNGPVPDQAKQDGTSKPRAFPMATGFVQRRFIPRCRALG